MIKTKIAIGRSACRAALALTALALGLWAGGFVETKVAADEAAPKESNDPAPLRLSLKNGGFVLGSPLASDQPHQIRWMSDQFEGPLSFDVRAMRSVTGSDSPPAAVSGHSFLLESGTRISGDLVHWGEETVTVRSDDCGTVSLDRKELRSIESNEIVGRRLYAGPRSIDQWSVLPNTNQWEFLSGSLVTKVKGARLSSDVRLPPKFRLSLAMSWADNPDFVLAIGCEKPLPKVAPNANNQGVRRAVVNTVRRNYGTRIEMWDAHLATVREVGNLADIAVLPLDEASKRFSLTFYIDQIAGIVAIYSNRGRMLEKIVVPGEKDSDHPYVLLENFGQQISLDQFDVFEWDGHLPESMDFPDSYVLSRDDKVTQGEIVGFDAESGELSLLTDEGESSTMKLGTLRRSLLARKPDASAGQDKGGSSDEKDEGTQNGEGDGEVAKSGDDADGQASEPDPTRLIEVQLHGGCRLIGYVAGSQEDQVLLQCDHVRTKDDGPLSFSSSGVVSMTGSETRFRSDDEPQGPVSQGKLRTESTELVGHLVADDSSDDAGVLVWKPWASDSAVTVRPDARGEIQFISSTRVVKQKPAAAVDSGNRDDAISGLINGVFGKDNARPSAASVEPRKPTALEPAEMIFQSGDSIRGIIEQIDERGMKLSSASTDTSHVPHQKIHSVLLRPTRGAEPPEVEKMKRLMTVPRQMRDDPPTHLLIAPTGDFLRCRLIAMDEQHVTVEVRLQIRQIPVGNVSRIIWLHEFPWMEKEEEAVEGDADIPEEVQQAESGDTFLVHAIRASGRGVTFEPHQCDGETLSGKSELLGECSVQLSDLSLLLFGSDVGQRAQERREESWKLSLAKLPRVFDEDATGGDTSAGKQADLVGKRAPDIRLNTIDGERFDIKEHRGKWVVLDFWASWCGPCIRTMPEVDEIIESLGRDDLMLVAVNLQDSNERAKLAVDRMGLSGALVVMDVDGETGRFYNARAIPQTVVVDPEGTVTHVFVGGGDKFLKDFEASLRESLEMPAE